MKRTIEEIRIDLEKARRSETVAANDRERRYAFYKAADRAFEIIEQRVYDLEAELDAAGMEE